MAAFINSSAARFKCIPSQESGRWQGDRGESLCCASLLASKRILASKALDGIEYRDGEPDFSPVSESTVQIGYMTDHRHNAGVLYGRDGRSVRYSHTDGSDDAQRDIHHADPYSMADLHMKFDTPGNFEQADILTAAQWSRENGGNQRWSPEDVLRYREENNLTWHECNDRTTMMLVPYVINADFPHLGGVAEEKERNRIIAEVSKNDVDYDDSWMQELDLIDRMSDQERSDYFQQPARDRDITEAQAGAITTAQNTMGNHPSQIGNTEDAAVSNRMEEHTPACQNEQGEGALPYTVYPADYTFGAEEVAISPVHYGKPREEETAEGEMAGITPAGDRAEGAEVQLQGEMTIAALAPQAATNAETEPEAAMAAIAPAPPSNEAENAAENVAQSMQEQASPVALEVQQANYQGYGG